LVCGKITVLKSLINNVFLSFGSENLGYIRGVLGKEIKKPLNQAKDPEVKERTYDAYYFICAIE
jgi:hypothetical protein